MSWAYPLAGFLVLALASGCAGEGPAGPAEAASTSDATTPSGTPTGADGGANESVPLTPLALEFDLVVTHASAGPGLATVAAVHNNCVRLEAERTFVNGTATAEWSSTANTASMQLIVTANLTAGMVKATGTSPLRVEFPLVAAAGEEALVFSLQSAPPGAAASQAATLHVAFEHDGAAEPRSALSNCGFPS